MRDRGFSFTFSGDKVSIRIRVDFDHDATYEDVCEVLTQVYVDGARRAKEAIKKKKVDR